MYSPIMDVVLDRSGSGVAFNNSEIALEGVSVQVLDVEIAP